MKAKAGERGRAPTGDPAHRVEGVEAAEDDEGRGADGQQQHGPGDGGGHSPAQNLGGNSVRGPGPASPAPEGCPR